VSSTFNGRRQDPTPMVRGGELAALAAGAALILAALAALAGLGTASYLFGGGWVWPRGTNTIGAVLASLLTRHPGHGLPSAQEHLLAGVAQVRACVIFAELITTVATVTAAVLFSRHRRPGDARGGMATRSEARAVLGLGQLRTAKSIIRPDLYPPRDTKQEGRNR
jgi:hypothetical protein